PTWRRIASFLAMTASADGVRGRNDTVHDGVMGNIMDTSALVVPSNLPNLLPIISQTRSP
ncbi:MAG: hypothetical protein LBT42_05325, partial [Tannerella sp.]|nr:hypothetical protein [Tannerella sp.]